MTKTVYIEKTIEKINKDLTYGEKNTISSEILAWTVSHYITSTRDILGDLEIKTQDPRTIRGNSDYKNKVHERKKNSLRLRDVNKETDETRDRLFTLMVDDFRRLDENTNTLGKAINLLVDYLSERMDGEWRNEVLSFTPEAKYDEKTGKIFYRITKSKAYERIENIPEIDKLRKKLQDDKLVESFIELKLAGATLRASINAKTLYEVREVKNYPSDPHSEVMDAIQTIEGNLGYLYSKLTDENRDFIKKCTPSRWTQFLQNYEGHKSSAKYARVVGILAIVTGVASILLGVPQLEHWFSSLGEKLPIDLGYTPTLPNVLLDIPSKVLTSYGVGAIISGGIIGSDIGAKIVRDFRRFKLRKIREI